MVLVAILSLALAEGNFFYIALALAGGLLPVILNREVSFTPLANYLIIFCCILFAIWDYTFATKEFVLALAHFLILIQIFKLACKKTNRDYMWIYLISLLHLAVAGIVTTELSFAVPFVLYMISATWSLILFHLKREIEIAAAEGKTEPDYGVGQKGLVSGYFFVGTGVLSFATLILTALFFVIIPRLSAGYLLRTSFRQAPVTGFSEEVNLGVSGDIRQGYEEVMRVKLIQPAGRADELCYFHGVALSHYTGEKWLKVSPEVFGLDVTDEEEAAKYESNEGRRRIRHLVSKGRKAFLIEPAVQGERQLVARYWVSPLETDVVFVTHPVRRLEFFSKESPDALEMDILGSLYNPTRQFGYIAYDAVSRMPAADEKLLNSVRTRRKVDGIDYTVLPTPSRYFRLRELQEFALGLARQSNANTPYRIAKAIEDGLSQSCSYSLSIERTPEVEPVYDFLFNKKKGHCELFASAMAVLLRTLGIPARVVNGYRGGLWNEYGAFYLIRQKDAHCWVEVFFDDDDDPTNANALGWVIFDPAPPAPLEVEGFFTPINKFIAYLRLKWIDYVISYSFEEQVEIAVKVRRQTRGVSDWFSNVFQKIRTFFSDPSQSSKTIAMKVFLPFFTLMTALGIAYYLLRGRRRKIPVASFATSPSLKFYRDLIRLAGMVGIARKPDQTPLEFAQVFCAVASARNRSAASALRDGILFITEKFCDARYGKITLPEEDSRKILHHLKAVKNLLRRKRQFR
jgi:transglutaminase-like putative cysteine protease